MFQPFTEANTAIENIIFLIETNAAEKTNAIEGIMILS